MHNRTKSLAASSGAALALVLTASADTYTWTGAVNGTWNTSNLNWENGAGTAVAWSNDSPPNDAVFNGSSTKTITLNTQRAVGNFTLNENGYKFIGNGPLAVDGTLSINKSVQILVPLGSAACPIYVANDAWLKLGASAGNTNTVSGRIIGECPVGFSWPTNTHFLAERSSSSAAGGGAMINSGAGVTNDVGTLSVRSSLLVQSGVVRVSSGKFNIGDGSGETDGGNALILVGGNGSGYDDAYGRLVVAAGAEMATPEETWGGTVNAVDGIDWQAQANRYAQVEVYGRVHLPNVKWFNARGSASTLTVGGGGEMLVGTLRLSSGDELSVVNLAGGGTLSLRNFEIGSSASGYPCEINFDGGIVHPLPVVGSIDKAKFLGEKNSSDWNNVSLNVLSGGAIFETVEETAYCNLPFVSGVSAGERDGGITVRGGNSKVFVMVVAGSSYNGPTVVESGELQVRAANGLPSGTVLKVGTDGRVGFNTYAGESPDVAQTVARAEGTGLIYNNSGLTVTGGVSPVFGGRYGTLSFRKPCNLSGSLDIPGDADGCGCVKFEGAGQSLANLTLRVADASALAQDKGGAFYKVVDAPNGFAAGGARFAALDLPGGWDVRYTDNAVYLRHVDATVVFVR